MCILEIISGRSLGSKIKDMGNFNCNALVTEASANHMRSSEAGMVLLHCPKQYKGDGLLDPTLTSQQAWASFW